MPEMVNAIVHVKQVCVDTRDHTVIDMIAKELNGVLYAKSVEKSPYIQDNLPAGRDVPTGSIIVVRPPSQNVIAFRAALERKLEGIAGNEHMLVNSKEDVYTLVMF